MAPAPSGKHAGKAPKLRSVAVGRSFPQAPTPHHPAGRAEGGKSPVFQEFQEVGQAGVWSCGQPARLSICPYGSASGLFLWSTWKVVHQAWGALGGCYQKVNFSSNSPALPRACLSINNLHKPPEHLSVAPGGGPRLRGRCRARSAACWAGCPPRCTMTKAPISWLIPF